MFNDNELDFSPLGLMISDLTTKTAADQASKDLSFDSYYAGLEAGLGLNDDAVMNMAKTASQEAGREIMTDFVARMFLSKE